MTGRGVDPARRGEPSILRKPPEKVPIRICAPGVREAVRSSEGGLYALSPDGQWIVATDQDSNGGKQVVVFERGIEKRRVAVSGQSEELELSYLIRGAFLVGIAPFGLHWIEHGPEIRTITGLLFGAGVVVSLCLWPLERFRLRTARAPSTSCPRAGAHPISQRHQPATSHPSPFGRQPHNSRFQSGWGLAKRLWAAWGRATSACCGGRWDVSPATASCRICA